MIIGLHKRKTTVHCSLLDKSPFQNCKNIKGGKFQDQLSDH